MNKYELAKSFFNSEEEIIYKEFNEFVLKEMLKHPNPNDFTGVNLTKYIKEHPEELFAYKGKDGTEKTISYGEIEKIRQSSEKDAFYQILVEFLNDCGNKGIDPKTIKEDNNYVLLNKFIQDKISETTV